MADAQNITSLRAVGGAITKGHILQRIASGGEQRVQHCTDGTVGGAEEIVGIALETLTAAQAALNPLVSFLVMGFGYVKTGAAIVVANHYLMSNATGQSIVSAGATDIITGINILGQTSAGAGEDIYVFTTHFIKDAV